MKTLLLDIETSPLLSYIWGLFQETRSMDFVVTDWYILCRAAKWLDEKTIMTSALPDFDLYKKDKENDVEVLKIMWKLLDEADCVIAHNGIKFDIRKINARFIKHGMNPPSPYKVIDTLKEARKYFKFSSNRLDSIGQFLELGKKMDTGGFDLWKECLAGNMKSWRKMARYNKQDVRLLEKVYLKLRPYMRNHPNVGLYSLSNDTLCPKCGAPRNTAKIKGWIFRGNYKAQVTEYKRIFCNVCEGWSRTRIPSVSTEKRKSLIVNAI